MRKLIFRKNKIKKKCLFACFSFSRLAFDLFEFLIYLVVNLLSDLLLPSMFPRFIGSSCCVDFLLYSSLFRVCVESLKSGNQSRRADSCHVRNWKGMLAKPEVISVTWYE